MRDWGALQASYVRQATRALEAATGVRLADVRADVERLPSAPLASRAVRAGTDPAEYAREVADLCGLVPVGSHDADLRNASAAAIVAKVADDPSWTLGADGSAYREDHRGIVRVRAHVGGEVDSSFGVDFHRSVSGTLRTVEGRAVVEGASFVAQARGIDHDEAMAEEAHAPRM